MRNLFEINGLQENLPKRKLGFRAALAGAGENAVRIFRNAGMACLLLLTGTVSFLPAQDFSDIGKRKPFRLSGSLHAQTATRLSKNLSFRDPFSYSLSLQLTPEFYGISLPFSLTYADSRFRYTQPFSLLSMTPSYKWIKAYVGRTQMDMNPYGLSSYSFDGAGIELTPSAIPLSFSAMYGRFAKAVQGSIGDPDSLASGLSGTLPVYKRSGYAFKLGFSKDNQQISLHLLRIGDKASSLPEQMFPVVSPAANAVWGVDFRFQLYDGLYIEGTGAVSALTENTMLADMRPKGVWAAMTGFLIPQNSTSSFSTAYKIGIGYKGIRLGYERVSPEYRSFGAYFINRDFQNVVLAFSHTFEKVDLKVDLGWQQDDLQNRNAGRSDRVVGSAFLNYRIREDMQATLSYSNFTTHTRLKPVELTRPDDPLVQDPDTVAFRQIAQQAAASFQYTAPASAKVRQQIGFDLSYQSSREMRQKVFNDYVFAGIRHGVELGTYYTLQSGLNFSTRIDRLSKSETDLTYSIGPSIDLGRTFFEKTLSLNGGLDYYFDVQGKKAQNSVAGIRLRVSYLLKKAHSFSLQIQTRLRSSFVPEKPAPGHEFQLLLSYRYRFSLSPYAKKEGKTVEESETEKLRRSDR